ncbi:MAG: HD domain-containing protein [Deltaproteobacteria bacterium]|nr:MAG: HD domain-containing protein [Deltaproteobacteria bacterium]
MAGKIRFENLLVENPQQVELARSYEDKLQALGKALLSDLYMLVRNVKLYDPENEIFNKPLEKLKDCINTIIAMDHSLTLQGAGESFYLNNMLLKVDINSLDNVRYLLAEFQRRNVGGFSLSSPIAIPELRNFIYIFSRESNEQVGEKGTSSRKLQALKLRRWEKIQEILKDQHLAETTDRQVDRKRYAVTVYARAVYFMRKYLAGLRGEGPEIAAGKANRYIQDLVDVCHGYRNQFLGLTSMKNEDEYLCFHSVNVALMAIVFGAELGLDKARLRELGVCALFHDIGKVRIGDQIMEKPGRLEPAEMQVVKRAPLYTVKQLLRGRRLNSQLIWRIITACEHKTEFGTPVKDLKGNVSFIVPKADLSVFSKIIAIADCYDALTSRRPFRDAFSPEIALTLMWTELKHKFDPQYLKIFMSVMKLPAVRVLSDKGERVVVF